MKDEGKCLTKRIPLEVAEQYLGLITFNRPKEMNPMDWGTVRELRAAVENLSADKSVRVIAITGAGKAFSAGGDLKAYMTLYRDEEGFANFLADMNSLCNFMHVINQPVIGLVNGYCVAGGIELLMALDFAYMAESAKIGDGHANYGQVGGGGSQVTLPRSIGHQRAFELIYTGKLLTAREALEWGLVNRVVPDDKLIDAGLEFANVVAKHSPRGIALQRQILWRGLYSMTAEDHLAYERALVHHNAVTGYDAYEGLVAFSEKRQPKFEGR